jgi:hypothetical protein
MHPPLSPRALFASTFRIGTFLITWPEERKKKKKRKKEKRIEKKKKERRTVWCPRRAKAKTDPRRQEAGSMSTIFLSGAPATRT